MRDVRTLLTLLLLLGCSTSTPRQQAPTPAEPAWATRPAHGVRAWEHESSDIPVDPRIHFGHLESGLRYAWADNPEPKDRVYLRMHVDAGSLAETERERGLAHFLEHMAFNGSEHFAAGTLIEWFQEHGMGFGADTNAHTAFSETVYKLDLPARDEETIREGLTVLRDFAGGLQLADEEVQAEKGVIDGEERENDDVQYRIFEQRIAEQYRGTRYAERIPIGAKAVRDTFDESRVRGFYERWYRPENITLIVVGDLRGLSPEELIAEAFGDFEGPGTPVALEPDRGHASGEELAYVITEPELSVALLTVAELKPYEDRPDTIALRRERLPLRLARQMVNLRFSEKVKEEGTPYLEASVGAAGGLQIFEGGELRVAAAPERWKEAMTAALLELRGALEFGFQVPELEEVRADWRRALDEAVEREATAPSRSLFDPLLDAAKEGGVPTDAETEREILLPALDTLTPEDCLEALRADWEGGARCLNAIGNLSLEDPALQLGAVYDAAFAMELEPPKAVEAIPFAYCSDPADAGAVASRESLEELGLTQVVFENGVRLNVKQTDFEERQILLRVRVGDGELALDERGLVVAAIGADAYTGGGLEAHSIDDLRRLLAGREVGVSMSVEPDHFRLEGATTAEDLLLELELLCATLEHPGYRPGVLGLIHQQLPLVFEQYRHRFNGPLLFEFLPAALLGDPRGQLLGLDHFPSLEALETIDIDEVRNVFSAALSGAPIEVTIVGDLDVEETIRLVARTFGALPVRAGEFETKPAPRPAWIEPGVRLESEVETADTSAQVLILFPAADGSETARRRNTYFLGRIVDDRLRLKVREELGAAYSPFAGAEASRTFPRLGAVMIQAASDPTKVDALVEACAGIASDLAENGVTPEEVHRLAEPLLAALRDARRTNEYWIDVLDECQRTPSILVELRDVVEFYEHLDARALSELAASCLDPERSSVLVVRPVPAGDESDG